jgi:hypothetical protein
MATDCSGSWPAEGPYFFGVGVGLCEGVGVGFLEGVGEGVGVTRTPLARGVLLIGTVGTDTAPGLRFVKYRASGTTIMPTMTVSTKVTAPHSRLTKAQFTSREL